MLQASYSELLTYCNFCSISCFNDFICSSFSMSVLLIPLNFAIHVCFPLVSAFSAYSSAELFSASKSLSNLLFFSSQVEISQVPASFFQISLLFHLLFFSHQGQHRISAFTRCRQEQLLTKCNLRNTSRTSHMVTDYSLSNQRILSNTLNYDFFIGGEIYFTRGQASGDLSKKVLNHFDQKCPTIHSQFKLKNPISFYFPVHVIFSQLQIRSSLQKCPRDLDIFFTQSSLA